MPETAEQEEKPDMTKQESEQSATGASRASHVGIEPGDVTDVLPDDLNAVDHVSAYRFPDNSRRRIPGVLYAVVATVSAIVWVTGGSGGVVNDGFLLAAILLAVVSVFSLTSGWRMGVDESEALVVATRAVGFAVGHASAQQVWRGFRSRPTWRIFCYSAEDPPLTRALVLVDAVHGDVVETLVETNPEVRREEP